MDLGLDQTHFFVRRRLLFFLLLAGFLKRLDFFEQMVVLDFFLDMFDAFVNR